MTGKKQIEENPHEKRMYGLLGRLLTKKPVWSTHSEEYDDEEILERERGYVYGADENTRGGYRKSERIDSSTDFEGVHVEKNQVIHRVFREDRCPVFCDVTGDHIQEESTLVMKLSCEGIDFTIVEKDEEKIRNKVFGWLKKSRSIEKHWGRRLKSENGFSGGYNKIQVGTKKYEICIRERATTPGVDDRCEKPEINLVRAVRAPANVFWQPYSVDIQLLDLTTEDSEPSDAGNFDEVLESRVVMETARDIAKKHDGLIAFRRKSDDYSEGGIYLGHSNVRTHEDADALIKSVELYHGMESQIQRRINELSSMPYKDLRASLPELLPVSGK